MAELEKRFPDPKPFASDPPELRYLGQLDEFLRLAREDFCFAMVELKGDGRLQIAVERITEVLNDQPEFDAYLAECAAEGRPVPFEFGR